MTISSSCHLAYLRIIVFVCVLATVSIVSGCASTYVDTATKNVPVSEMKKIIQPKPVQLVFEFQTKGAPNARGTEFLKEAVTKQVQESGLFSSIEASPANAMLNITLNNVPLTEDAAAKGFVTGLTFGLAGSAVTDGYICTLTYLPPGQSTPIVKTARHSIHTTLGNAAAPAGAQRSSSIADAVHTMSREVLSNALKDLSYDKSFD